MRTTSMRPGRIVARLVAPLAVTGLALGAVSVAAPAAQAIGGGTGQFSAGSGQVGVQQVVTYTLNGTIAPGTPVSIIASSSTNPPVTAATVSFLAGLQGTFAWTPPHVGTWSFCADGFTCSGSTTIKQVSTTTTVTAPNTVKLGAPTTVTATVTPQAGSVMAPLGQVQFSIVGGGNYGAPVWLNGGGPSTASVQWTPGTLGQVAWQATYIPYVVNGVADTTCGNACTSAPDVIQVTTSGTNFFLSNPGTINTGAAATLQGVVSVVPPTGTVTFTINGAPIAANVPVNAQGIAQTTWTPPAPGQYTLGGNWVGNGGQRGTATEVLTVGSAPAQPDSIVVRDQNGNVLNPATPYSAPNGASASFTVQTSSGAQVSVTESGPCTISGSTVSATQGNGQCRVTVASPGGNGFAAASVTYMVTLVPGTQTAKLAAPASGNVNVGKVLTLQKASQGTTNAGQTISWKITKGKNSVCVLQFPSNGAIKLKMKAKGTCNVKASAAAVSGQWNAFTLTRSYKGV